ncbi:MAG: glutathione S-transferase family protein [Synechococcus sp.]|nr:glutathione S-transferase family protein [Synechococcus sp.]
MELFQFRHSAFCEKVHLLLCAKGLRYSVRDVTPGVGQLELFQLSGQRQVPVLRDGEELIPDSTAIALHLEARHPEPSLLPADPQLRAQVLLLEDWADTALASGARLALLQGAAEDPLLRSALLPEATPSVLRNLIGAVPGDLLGGMGQLLQNDRQSLIFALEQLLTLIEQGPYLVGSSASLADVAVAAQLYLLRFPLVAGPQLAARGIAGIADQPRFEPLFQWRDELYRSLGRWPGAAADAPAPAEPVAVA